MSTILRLNPFVRILRNRLTKGGNLGNKVEPPPMPATPISQDRPDGGRTGKGRRPKRNHPNSIIKIFGNRVNRSYEKLPKFGFDINGIMRSLTKLHNDTPDTPLYDPLANGVTKEAYHMELCLKQLLQTEVYKNRLMILQLERQLQLKESMHSKGLPLLNEPAVGRGRSLGFFNFMRKKKNPQTK